ncbi:inositol monophosphatase family protein [Phytohalomonas tamaricis]|uniref:inositol monophosphatase family protein n=1 Tax=Phytohalomonas tamaricis TaxID=2081032 RepID=UPI000D0B03D2|nr:inositol monophosphatase family protein [Phytohalomonas tamaricis]
MHPMVQFALRALRGASEQFIRVRDRIDDAREDRVLDTLLEETARQAEASIVRQFARGYPQHGISGRYTPYREGADRDYQWKIELFHGYANLAANTPGWAISLTSFYKGRAENAVIISPFTDEEYLISRGRGAQLNGKRIRVPARNGLSGSRVALGLPESWMRSRHLPAYLTITQQLGSQVDVLRTSGCPLLDLAELACGRVDSAFVLGIDEHDLDVATLMLKEAGALIGGADGSPQVEPEGVLMAAGPRLYKNLVQVLKPHL